MSKGMERFFSVSPALIMFCHSLKPTGIVITTAHSWMGKCTKFGQLFFSKIIKTVATSCQISRLICTKFDFGWGSAPDPAGGAHSAPPDSLAVFKGPISKGREGGTKEGRRKGKGERDRGCENGKGEERNGDETGKKGRRRERGGERGEGRFASS